MKKALLIVLLALPLLSAGQKSTNYFSFSAGYSNQNQRWVWGHSHGVLVKGMFEHVGRRHIGWGVSFETLNGTTSNYSAEENKTLCYYANTLTGNMVLKNENEAGWSWKLRMGAGAWVETSQGTIYNPQNGTHEVPGLARTAVFPLAELYCEVAMPLTERVSLGVFYQCGCIFDAWDRAYSHNAGLTTTIKL